MKKNKNIKILLPIVIAVWGILIYKIVDAFSSGEKTMTSTSKTTFTPPVPTPKDTFELLPIERDPFLGTLYHIKAAKNNGTPTKKREKINWPQIQYLGIVSDDKTTSSVYIININGAQHLFSKKQTIEGITLQSGSNDSVTLKFKEEKKNFDLM